MARRFPGLVWVVALALKGGGSLALAQGPPEAVAVPSPATMGADGVQRATLILDSYSYSPSHLAVQAGKVVELTLTSVTTLTPHNFVLKDGGLSIEQDVGAGKSVVVKFLPSQTGTFTFFCDKQLLFFKSHREKGMEGRLDVTP